MNRLSVARDGFINWAQRFQAVTQAPLQAQLVHRGLRPLWANSAFVDLFHFSSIADVLSCGCLTGLFDPDTDYDARAFGRRLLCRRDGARFPAEIFSTPVVWDGARAAALSIRDAREEDAVAADDADAWIFRPPPAPKRAHRKAARVVLVVHAWPEARRALAAELAVLGLQSDLAGTAGQALALFEARPFDLVITALDLPGEDGFALARRIRALPLPWARAPIAALVPGDGAALRDAIAAAGMDAWLGLPPSRTRLAEAISALTGSVEPAELDEIEEKDDRDEPGDRVDGHHVRAPKNV
ncbi:MAG: response regulator [Hyphomonadaceae bacterium]|nr:response regulator [Hyphomonadaceae bacterium]